MSVSPSYHIACDLGAESGRVMLGAFDGTRLTLEEVHRFPNRPLRLQGTLRWDLPGLYREILHGLTLVTARQLPIASVSVDAWAIDFALQKGAEPLLRLPFHYRDARNEPAFHRVRNPDFDARVFEHTGIQFIPLNTLYQFLADQVEALGTLEFADRFLMVPDWFHFLLSGRAVCEETNASTTQMYDPRSRTWSEELISLFGFPRHIFPEIVAPGTVLGSLTAEIADTTKLGPVPVIAGCTHDTAAAVAAVPAQGEDWAYLSSGTWSLIGVELNQPLINDAAREANFTNEVGYGGTIRFLKNLSGLWLLQECRRIWAKTTSGLDYAEIVRLASEAEPSRSVFNPLDLRFHAPADMTAEIRAACREQGQPEPETPGQFARAIFESLALLYTEHLDLLERLTGRTLRVLHIVGGGSQNALLNQLTASASGRTVLAGPVEATALGNVLSQLLALGRLDSLAAAREVVRASSTPTRFEPQDGAAWQAARARFAAFHQVS